MTPTSYNYNYKMILGIGQNSSVLFYFWEPKYIINCLMYIKFTEGKNVHAENNTGRIDASYS